MARFAGRINEETQDFENSAIAYSVDAFGISIGSLLGSPPCTAYIESGAGISEGGATGLTSIFTGLCFFIAIFFAPIFASIPPWATGPVLVIVGCLMCRAAKDINWFYLGDAIPAFITIAVMPFTYSIAYGLIGGIMSYICINTIVYILEKVSGGRIVPENKHLKDHWTYKIPGGFLPPWIQRLAKGKMPWHKDTATEGVTPVAEARGSDSLSSAAGEKHLNEKGLTEGTHPVAELPVSTLPIGTTQAHTDRHLAGEAVHNEEKIV
jgi:AGZA family xanthine/uracil permease-like MFS transporter